MQMDRMENKIDKILEDQVKIKVDVAEIKGNVAVNTRDLTEHKEGVIQNRKRIVSLEKPSIVMEGFMKMALWIASISGVLLAMEKLGIFKLWS